MSHKTLNKNTEYENKLPSEIFIFFFYADKESQCLKQNKWIAYPKFFSQMHFRTWLKNVLSGQRWTIDVKNYEIFLEFYSRKKKIFAKENLSLL